MHNALARLALSMPRVPSNRRLTAALVLCASLVASRCGGVEPGSDGGRAGADGAARDSGDDGLAGGAPADATVADGGPKGDAAVAAGGWLPLIARTEAQFNQKIAGGAGMQFFRSWATSPAMPDRVIGTEDIAIPIITDSFGDWWRSPRVVGLTVGISGQGAWIDPQDADRILVVYSASSRRVFPAWRDQAGIYLSTDGARTFKLVQKLVNISGSGEHGSRHMQHPIAAAPGGTPKTRTLYCFYSPKPKGGARQDGALYRSTDGGASWATFGEALTVAKFGDTLTTLRAAPNGDLYLASNKGVFRSTSGGKSWSRQTALPPGMVRQIDARGGKGEVWASVDKRGLFKSTDHGVTWKQNAALGTYDILTFGISPVDRRRICVAGNGTPRYSHDGGASWSKIVTEPALGQADGFAHTIKNTTAYFIWHEANPQRVLAQRNQHMGRSTDGGRTFVWASNNFDYSHTHTHGFHPKDWRKVLIALQDRLTLYSDNGFDWVHNDGIDVATKAKIEAEAGITGHIGGGEGALILVNGSHTGFVSGAGNGFTRTPVVHTASGDNPIGKATVPALANAAAIVRSENDPADAAVGYLGRWRVTLSASGKVSFTDIGREFVGCGKGGGVIFGVDKSGGQNIYRSTDGGSSWATWAKAPAAFRPIDSKPVVRVDPNHPARVYTASAAGKVFRIEGVKDPGATAVFDLVGELGPGLPGYEISEIAVDYFDPQLIYVASNTYGGACVFRSTDGGAKWQDITGNSPHQPGGIWVHPHTSDVIRSTQHGTHVYPPPAGHRAAFNIKASLYDRVEAYLRQTH